MKISYRRNLMKSHMIIEQKQSENIAEWEKEMIAHSNIRGMIFPEYVRENEQERLWYDISGKQALDSLFQTMHLNYEILCMLLLGIHEMLESLERFLLNPEWVLLCPECIFLDNEGQQIYFCCCPGTERALPEMFRELMEYLLAQLEHTDEKAVELAYGLYEQSVKEGFSLWELKNLLHMSYEKEAKADDGEDLQYMEENKKEELKKEEPPVENMSDRIRQKIMRIWEEFFSRKKKNRQEEPFVFEPDEEQEVKKSRPTVLLSEIVKAPEGVLRYEGNGEGRDLKIENESYVIGSDISCEGYIPSSTVSRKHARITREEDIYFIEDLNSSNGTYVGGELLNYRTKMSLQKNEIVMFADEKFRFI